MRIRAKEIYRTGQGEPETRFFRVIKEYENLYNSMLKREWVISIIAVCAVIMLICTVIGWFKIAAEKQKEAVVVIEVNELGLAKYAGRAYSGTYLKNYDVKDYMIESVIKQWIDWTRCIYVDVEVMQKNIEMAGRYMSREMQEKLRDELIESRMFDQAGRMRREVVVESIIGVTENTWQVDWFDVFKNMEGKEMQRMRMRGMFTVIRREPRTDNERENNALGLFIVDYNIIRVNEVER